MLASIVIRTYNEQQYLESLLSSIFNQTCSNTLSHEVVLVDSGSTDSTLQIAKKYNCRITHIRKEDFTYGKSLNVGCEFAKGDYFIFVSGHCIPASENWLQELCRPLIDKQVSYTYGRQVGKYTTKYSEMRHFEKWFPEHSELPQEGYFCNNANAAISREAWSLFRFDESLTGLEDMFLAKKLVGAGHKIGYVSSAPVFHIHNESWTQVRLRYERESYALHKVMPGVHFSLFDFFRFFSSSVYSDSVAAAREGILSKKALEIFLFRFNHYWGSYKGNFLVRELSKEKKNKYFYPKDLKSGKRKKTTYPDEKHVTNAKEL